MKVIILSFGLGCLPNYLKKNATILFIPNAGDTYKNSNYVREHINGLINLGYKDIELNLPNNNISYNHLHALNVDCLFITGGNTFYLLSILKKTGFDINIIKWIEASKTYIAVSVGVNILGPSLEPIDTLDDPSFALDLSTYDALSIIKFIVLPHYGKEKYLQRHIAILNKYQFKFKFQLLRDDEALVFNGPEKFTKIKSEVCPN